MILSKSDLKQYLFQDKLALGKEYKIPKVFNDDIWIFEILLRKTEYYFNCRKDIIGKFIYYFYALRLHNLKIKLGFSIPLNVFGPGLSIAHRGTIVVNGNSRVGKNCRIQESTTIGATNGDINAPIIGDNVFIGSGARIIGNIEIGNNVCIGANATVVKDCKKNNVTLGGVPAKVISNNNSISNLNKLLLDNDLI